VQNFANYTPEEYSSNFKRACTLRHNRVVAASASDAQLHSSVDAEPYDASAKASIQISSALSRPQFAQENERR
jgi:hypothetical protein